MKKTAEIGKIPYNRLERVDPLRFLGTIAVYDRNDIWKPGRLN